MSFFNDKNEWALAGKFLIALVSLVAALVSLFQYVGVDVSATVLFSSVSVTGLLVLLLVFYTKKINSLEQQNSQKSDEYTLLQKESASLRSEIIHSEREFEKKLQSLNVEHERNIKDLNEGFKKQAAKLRDGFEAEKVKLHADYEANHDRLLHHSIVEHKTKFAAALKSLNDGNCHIHSWQNELFETIPNFLVDNFINGQAGVVLEELVDDWVQTNINARPNIPIYLQRVADTLKLLYGKDYALCVKLVTPMEGQNAECLYHDIEGQLEKLTTVTWERSTGSIERCKIDKMIANEGKPLPSLMDNSDFRSIILSATPLRESKYLSNNLPAEKKNSYLNTSTELYKRCPEIFRGLGSLTDDEWAEWGLPYRSALILPICPMQLDGKRDVSGFLCADSSEIDAFPDELILMLLRSVADNLYTVLSAYAVADFDNFIDEDLEESY